MGHTIFLTKHCTAW